MYGISCCHIAAAEFFSCNIKIFPVKDIERQTKKKRDKTSVIIYFLHKLFSTKLQNLRV